MPANRLEIWRAINVCNFNSTVLRTQPRAINATLWNSIPATDIRKQCRDLTGATVPVPPGGARVPYQNKKYLAKSDALSTGDVPYMRAAEMYLIEAEARARQGNNTAAQDALFTLKKNRDAAAFNLTRPSNRAVKILGDVSWKLVSGSVSWQLRQRHRSLFGNTSSQAMHKRGKKSDTKSAQSWIIGSKVFKIGYVYRVLGCSFSFILRGPIFQQTPFDKQMYGHLFDKVKVYF